MVRIVQIYTLPTSENPLFAITDRGFIHAFEPGMSVETLQGYSKSYSRLIRSVSSWMIASSAPGISLVTCTSYPPSPYASSVQM